MKILLLVQDEQRVILDKLYEAIIAAVGEGEVAANSAQQANLRNTFKDINMPERLPAHRPLPALQERDSPTPFPA